MKPLVKQITSDQFLNKVVEKKANALVKIGTAWNGASQMISQTLQDLALQYGNQIDFFSIDYEAESPLAITYRVEDTPTILFFKNGTLVDKLSGLTHRAVISHKIFQLVY
ncbi:MAG: thioredoxin family protein [Cyclobacteriaceae bacterium]|nr:thioredoxin family protein [Cyclobacteriaceae bacterium]